jgi:hypothetical protein
MLDDHIHAPTARETPHLVGESGRVVIDGFVSAERPSRFQFSRISGCGNDTRAVELRNLHGCLPDAASSRYH